MGGQSAGMATVKLQRQKNFSRFSEMGLKIVKRCFLALKMGKKGV
jgi:hypothetical protein